MKSRVLVVDDDQGLANVLARILSLEGYEVLTVNSGYDALAKAPEFGPDIILLDAMMPGIDGFETLRRMRDTDQLANVPIMMLTARSEIEDKEAGFSSGADDYVVKPFNPTEIKLRIAAHIRRHRLSSESDRYRPRYSVRTPIVIGRARSGMFLSGYRVTKRIMDFVLSLVALPVALPLIGLIALAIYVESPGKVFFVQERTGLHGKRFKMYKFRTMVPDAEELKAKYMHLNELTWPDFKITRDPRMTRVGRILRKTSLDELPQLVNILIGNMSIVGPRPTSFKPETYELWQTERLEVRPGLTGLWQVTGRSDIDFVERVELDIEYIERQSWALDLQIMWMTFAAVITSRGAS